MVKYSFPHRNVPRKYYELMNDNIVHHEMIFWDPNSRFFIDEDGLEIPDEIIHERIPLWAMRLAKMNFGPGKDNYFCYTPNSWTVIEIFWPDEEVAENWYQ